MPSNVALPLTGDLSKVVVPYPRPITAGISSSKPLRPGLQDRAGVEKWIGGVSKWWRAQIDRFENQNQEYMSKHIMGHQELKTALLPPPRDLPPPYATSELGHM